MSSHGITGPRAKVHEIRGINVDSRPRPLTLPNVVALRQKLRDISETWNKFAPRNSRL